MTELELLTYCLDSIQKQEQKEDKLINSICEILDCPTPVSTLSEDMYSALMMCLKYIFKDNSDWIQYYLCERPHPYRPCVWDKDGTEIPLETVEDLYNLLKDNRDGNT